MNAQPKVSVGVTTYAGYSTTLVGVILAVYAYTQGDRTAGTVGTIAAGVAFALTQIFRYVQAVVLAKQAQATANATTGTASTAEQPRTIIYGPPKQRQAKMTPVDTSSAPDTPESVAAEEAELPSDDEETQNTPVPDSALVPVAPAGEPPTDLPLPPPLEPGDTTEG